MDVKKAKNLFLYLYLSFLLISALLFTIIRFKDLMGESNYQRGIVELLKIYALPLATIVAGFAVIKANRSIRLDKTAFTAALLLSILWNLFVGGRVFLYAYHVPTDTDDISDVLDFIKTVSEYASFLITGSLTLVFGKKME